MKRIAIVCLGALGAYALAAVTNYAAMAQGDAAPNSYVKLQADTPGSAQTGNTNISGVSIAGSFQGMGSGLTNLNGSNISMGTVSDSHLSANVALLDAQNAFSATQNTFAGRVGIGVANPVVPLEVQGEVIRTIVRSQGYNQADQTDNGPLAARFLNFTKRRNSTGLRVTYTDNIRVLGSNVGGRWEVRFNGLSATPTPLAWDLYATSGVLTHTPTTLIGTAFNLAAGSYVVQIYVGPAPGYGVNDLYTGWQGAWSLEVEEVY